MRSYLNNEKGSSSVLLILVMLTLMVYGVFAMMTAYSGLQVARRHAAWNQRHYELESRGARLLAEAEQALLSAEAAAAEWEEQGSLPAWIDEVAALNSILAEADEMETGELYGLLAARLLETLSTAPLLPVKNGQELRYGTLLEATEQGGGLYIEIQVEAVPGKDSELMRVLAWKQVPETFHYDEGLEYAEPEETAND